MLLLLLHYYTLANHLAGSSMQSWLANTRPFLVDNVFDNPVVSCLMFLSMLCEHISLPTNPINS